MYSKIATATGVTALMVYTTIAYGLHHKEANAYAARGDVLRSKVVKVCDDNQCFELAKNEALPKGYLNNAPLGKNYVFNTKELKCLARNIYFESRGEPFPGQVKVGLSTINRVKDKRFPDTICQVVQQKAYVKRLGRVVHQMSWRADKSRYGATPPTKFIQLAKDILLGKHKQSCWSTNWYNPKKSVRNSFNERMIRENRTTCLEQAGYHIFLAYK